MKCKNSKFLRLCYDCDNCSNGYFLVGCKGLKDKQFHINNISYSTQKFFQILLNDAQYEEFNYYRQQFLDPSKRVNYAKKQNVATKKISNNKFALLQDLDETQNQKQIVPKEVVQKEVVPKTVTHKELPDKIYFQSDDPKTKVKKSPVLISPSMLERYKDELYVPENAEQLVPVLTVCYNDVVFYEYEGEQERDYCWFWRKPEYVQSNDGAESIW